MLPTAGGQNGTALCPARARMVGNNVMPMNEESLRGDNLYPASGEIPETKACELRSRQGSRDAIRQWWSVSPASAPAGSRTPNLRTRGAVPAPDGVQNAPRHCTPGPSEIGSSYLLGQRVGEEGHGSPGH